jgi:hypothetical protein
MSLAGWGSTEWRFLDVNDVAVTVAAVVFRAVNCLRHDLARRCTCAGSTCIQLMYNIGFDIYIYNIVPNKKLNSFKHCSFFGREIKETTTGKSYISINVSWYITISIDTYPSVYMYRTAINI